MIVMPETEQKPPRYFHGPWVHRELNQKNLKQFAEAFRAQVVLYDLGATGGTPPPFLFLGDHVQTVNFEPDERGSMDPSGVNLCVAVGPEHLNTLYLNRRPTTSSLLRPNQRVNGRYDWQPVFGSDADIFETIDTEEVTTLPLDEVVKVRQLELPDFCKIDVQGLTLEVLEGGCYVLDTSVLGLVVEVEFIESYEGQKTVGAVHQFLEQRGFEIFRVQKVNRWYYATNLPLQHRTGQDTFCDLLCLRSIDSITPGSDFWSPDKARKMLQIMLLYDLIDAAAAFLEAFWRCGILSRGDSLPIENLISSWTNAIDFFYHEPPPKPVKVPARPSLLRRMLAISPLDVLRFLRDTVKRRS